NDDASRGLLDRAQRRAAGLARSAALRAWSTFRKVAQRPACLLLHRRPALLVAGDWRLAERSGVATIGDDPVSDRRGSREHRVVGGAQLFRTCSLSDIRARAECHWPFAA